MMMKLKNVEIVIFTRIQSKKLKILPLLLAIVGVVVLDFIFNEDNITNIDNNIVASLKPATFLDASVPLKNMLLIKQGCSILHLDFETILP